MKLVKANIVSLRIRQKEPNVYDMKLATAPVVKYTRIG